MGEVEEALILGSVKLPLGLVFQVVIHSLVAEIEVLVTEVGGSQLGAKLDLADQFLRATHLLGLVHSVDLVKD